MKLISELPEPYRYLAELRREQYEKNSKIDVIAFAFIFRKTIEGRPFWRKLCFDNILPPLKPRYRIKGSVITKMW